MSRNLCTSKCIKCGYAVKLSDMRDKPVEFRRYWKYAPTLGVKFECSCGEVYFIYMRTGATYWGSPYKAFDDNAWGGLPNTEKGRFVAKNGDHWVETGYFELDLSHYWTYNDEPDYRSEIEQFEARANGEKPWHLCEDEADDVQRIL